MIKKTRLAVKLKILHGAECLWFGFIHLLACINWGNASVFTGMIFYWLWLAPEQYNILLYLLSCMFFYGYDLSSVLLTDQISPLWNEWSPCFIAVSGQLWVLSRWDANKICSQPIAISTCFTFGLGGESKGGSCAASANQQNCEFCTILQFCPINATFPQIWRHLTFKYHEFAPQTKAIHWQRSLPHIHQKNGTWYTWQRSSRLPASGTFLMMHVTQENKKRHRSANSSPGKGESVDHLLRQRLAKLVSANINQSNSDCGMTFKTNPRDSILPRLITVVFLELSPHLNCFHFFACVHYSAGHQGQSKHTHADI